MKPGLKKVSTSCLKQTLWDSIKKVEYWDFEEILSWFAARDIVVPAKWVFSDIGYIVPKVAAGFLYTSNSGIATLDCFITNPKASSEDRLKGLRTVRDALLVKANTIHSIHKVCCTTQHSVIELIANESGFLPSGSFKAFYKLT